MVIKKANTAQDIRRLKRKFRKIQAKLRVYQRDIPAMIKQFGKAQSLLDDVVKRHEKPKLKGPDIPREQIREILQAPAVPKIVLESEGRLTIETPPKRKVGRPRLTEQQLMERSKKKQIIPSSVIPVKDKKALEPQPNSTSLVYRYEPEPEPEPDEKVEEWKPPSAGEKFIDKDGKTRLKVYLPEYDLYTVKDIEPVEA